jgi:predicted phosphodiesterase
MVTGRARGSVFGLVRMVLAASLGLVLVALLLVFAGTSVWQAFAMPAQAGSSSGDYLPPRAPEAVTLTRGPYLQSVTTDSIVVVWETDGPADSRVDYGPTTIYGLAVSSDISVTHHALTLTGLSPHSLYHYRVSSNGLALGEDSTFRAAAGPTQTGFSFVVFGDTATNGEAHPSVVNRAVALAPDFVLHNGDFVEDGRVAGQWTTFFTIEHALLRQSPLYGTLGNDDMSSPNYFDAFHLPGNERWYSFDYGNAHIVSLEMDDDSDFEPGNSQYAWLDNDLANTDRQWKIVFFHVPPYTPAALSTLVPLLAKHGVDIVFSGHVHLYERTVFDGVVYIISGGGGEPLYSGSLNPYSAYYTSTYHCVLITINGRSLTSVGVRPDGVEFDPFTLYAPPNVYLPLILSHSSGP